MARILILADIHANREALEAVLVDAGACSAIWCLGDMIGYGPDPAYCLRWAQEHCALVLAGNHDRAAVEFAHLERFNPAARVAAEWTQAQLSPEDCAYVRSIPSARHVPYPEIAALMTPPVPAGGSDVALAHGSPARPPEGPVWTYILTAIEAAEAFDAPEFPGPLCFVGHSHVAVAYQRTDAGTFRVAGAANATLDLSDARYIVNPGSVGQPRDRDPRAAYLIYDPRSSQAQWHRVAYDVATTQAKMRAADLPDRLIARLARGT